MDRVVIPFRQFVLKVHSRCDLACNHCYVYEHADQSWRGRPPEISRETAALAARRIAEHAAKHRLSEVRVVLHGGEPLLLGPRRTREVIDLLRDAMSATDASLDLRIHTNAVLLDRLFLDLFVEYDVKVGVSLDGDRESNDRHRLYRDGRSSYDKVVRALELLREPQYRGLYTGLLCTIDVENDPVAVYRGLLEHEPPRVDLLLPHATWDTQPPGLRAPRDLSNPRRTTDGGSPEYASWLRRIFDVWDAEGRPVPVRIFDSLLAALHGRPSQTESLGLVPTDLAVIETDGTIEQADSLKTAYAGAPFTGLDVRRNSLDEAAEHAGITARQQGLDGLSPTCQACPVATICGGGLYAHRYAPGTGFDNPSVYCADLVDLIMHIQRAEQNGESRRSPSQSPSEQSGAHVLSQADIDTLAAGYGEAATVLHLAEAQRSIVRNLLVKIAQSGPQHDSTFTTAWDRFAQLDDTEPEAVDTVLAHPYVRAWAVQCIADLGQGAAGDFGYLAALNASVIARANGAERFRLPVRDGVVHLPTFGALAVPSAAGEAIIDVDAESLTIRTADSSHHISLTSDTHCANPPNWRRLRRLHAQGLTVTIEDSDPYRRCHGYAADRLTDDEAAHWEAAFPAALAFVDEHLPQYSPGLRAGLVTAMPMSAPADGSHRSAAARNAFGAVGAALPNDPALLALLLVHEFQHVKLGAVLDLYTLFDPTDTAPRHYAPWRPDPRPLEGLLQGTYAHIAVTEFWRVRREHTHDAEQRLAEEQFARWRVHTAEAVDQLIASGSLTPLGERFVLAMGRTVAPWLDEPVDAAAEAAARKASTSHRAAFLAATAR